MPEGAGAAKMTHAHDQLRLQPTHMAFSERRDRREFDALIVEARA
jgi:hypothetical protein